MRRQKKVEDTICKLKKKHNNKIEESDSKETPTHLGAILVQERLALVKVVQQRARSQGADQRAYRQKEKEEKEEKKVR